MKKNISLFICMFFLLSCKKQNNIGVFDSTENAKFLINQANEINMFSDVITDDFINKTINIIKKNNKLEYKSDKIEFLDFFCIQDNSDKKIQDVSNSSFLYNHNYFLITFEIGDIYEYHAFFDLENDISPVYTKTIFLGNNSYGYLKWWKISNNQFQVFNYYVTDIDGNKKYIAFNNRS